MICIGWYLFLRQIYFEGREYLDMFWIYFDGLDMKYERKNNQQNVFDN